MRRGELTDVDLSNLDLSFDFDDSPVFWLGSVSDEESVAHLRDLFSGDLAEDAREDLVGAIGMHDSFALVRPFLVEVLDSRADNDVREAAVFWLHKDDTRETRMYLVRLAERDASEDVREQAVFALNLMKSDEALDRLIALARTANDEDVREKARFWLGQKASTVFASDADESPASEIQKQAVFALAQMDDDGGVDELIRLVHDGKSPVIRKQALFWLGQTDDTRALDLIVSILRPGS
jgi:HEAT repeat protein